MPLGIGQDDQRLGDFAPCPENRALLCGELAFGGQVWTAALAFQNKALASIALSGPLGDTYTEAAIQGLKDSPYVLYSAVTERACFDFIEKAREGLTPERIDGEFAAFLAEMRGEGHAFASYFYTEPAIYEAVKNIPPATSLPCGPQPTEGVPAGAACCLAIEKDGITFLVMSWADWQKELAAKTFFGR